MFTSKYLIFPIRETNIRVGLLGGSFNPAHSGHLKISVDAIKLLHLDCVVWLISPQNPMKSLDIRHTLSSRLAKAVELTKRSRNVIVCDIEKHFKTTFSVNTIIRLQAMHPCTEFVWIMGADNMLQIHKWYRWQEIFEKVSVAVFNRGECCYKVLRCKGACCYSEPEVIQYGDFVQEPLKRERWMFVRSRVFNISSSEIRSSGVSN